MARASVELAGRARRPARPRPRNACVASFSLVKACTCARRRSARRHRPKRRRACPAPRASAGAPSARRATSGSTISGMAASTKPDSRGLVTTIMTAAPMKSTRLRSAIETEAPTADLICVVSAVSRETISPVCAVSKKAGRQRRQMARNLAAQIGDDALAERGDEIEAQRARHREHRRPPQSSRRNSCRSGPSCRRRSRNRSCGARRSAPRAWRARRQPAPARRASARQR